jgi:hypothetical protein
MSLEHPGELCATAHAKYAERIALAIVMGEVSDDAMADAHEQLRMHARAAEVERRAKALRAYRAGRPVWTWPATAPWAGFA